MQWFSVIHWLLICVIASSLQTYPITAVQLRISCPLASNHDYTEYTSWHSCCGLIEMFCMVSNQPWLNKHFQCQQRQVLLSVGRGFVDIRWYGVHWQDKYVWYMMPSWNTARTGDMWISITMDGQCNEWWFIIPPLQRSWRGVHWFYHGLPSVRLYVDRIVSALYLQNTSRIHFIFTYLIN